MKTRYLSGFEIMRKLAPLVVLLAGCSVQVDATQAAAGSSSAGAPSVAGSSGAGGSGPGFAGSPAVLAGSSSAGAPSVAGQAGAPAETSVAGAAEAGASAGGALEQGGAPAGGSAQAGGGSSGALEQGGSPAGGAVGSAGAPGVACPYHISSEGISAQSGHTITATFTVLTEIEAVDLSPLAGYMITPSADGIQIAKAFAGGSLWQIPSNNRIKELVLAVTPYTAAPLMPAGGLALFCKGT